MCWCFIVGSRIAQRTAVIGIQQVGSPGDLAGAIRYVATVRRLQGQRILQHQAGFDRDTLIVPSQGTSVSVPS